VLLVKVTGPVKTAVAGPTAVPKATAPLRFTGLLTTAGVVMSGENVPPVSVRGPEPRLVVVVRMNRFAAELRMVPPL
jgi:hypothetical protein